MFGDFKVIFLFFDSLIDLVFTMLRCSSFLPHAMLDLNGFMLCVSGWTNPACCLILASWLWAAGSCLPHAVLLDLPCLLLYCLNFSQSWFAAIWFDLHGATLLDGLYLMLPYWTFPTICYVSGCTLYHVMIFNLVVKALRCLILSNSCYVLDLSLFCCFVFSLSCQFVF